MYIYIDARGMYLLNACTSVNHEVIIASSFFLDISSKKEPPLNCSDVEYSEE